MTAELRSYGDLDLPSFVHESGIEFSDIVRRGQRFWTQLHRDAAFQHLLAHAARGGLKRIGALPTLTTNFGQPATCSRSDHTSPYAPPCPSLVEPIYRGR